jgi:S-adenosylmethionine synthetase
MVLEAVAGKNPISHAGKIYSVLAREIAETLVAAVPEIAATQCIITSRIGAPITEPELLHVRIVTRDAMPVARMEPAIRDIAAARLRRAPTLVDDFIAGTIGVF